jgi:hypothetical protein
MQKGHLVVRVNSQDTVRAMSQVKDLTPHLNPNGSVLRRWCLRAPSAHVTDFAHRRPVFNSAKPQRTSLLAACCQHRTLCFSDHLRSHRLWQVLSEGIQHAAGPPVTIRLTSRTFHSACCSTPAGVNPSAGVIRPQVIRGVSDEYHAPV